MHDPCSCVFHRAPGVRRGRVRVARAGGRARAGARARRRAVCRLAGVFGGVGLVGVGRDRLEDAGARKVRLIPAPRVGSLPTDRADEVEVDDHGGHASSDSEDYWNDTGGGIVWNDL